MDSLLGTLRLDSSERDFALLHLLHVLHVLSVERNPRVLRGRLSNRGWELRLHLSPWQERPIQELQRRVSNLVTSDFNACIEGSGQFINPSGACGSADLLRPEGALSFVELFISQGVEVGPLEGALLLD